MYDQDFINDGYADGKPLRTLFVCSKCGRSTNAIVGFPSPELRCLEPMPRPNRQKGETRKIPCDTPMVEMCLTNWDQVRERVQEGSIYA